MDAHERARKLAATLHTAQRHALALRRESKDARVRQVCQDILRGTADAVADAEYLRGATEP